MRGTVVRTSVGVMVIISVVPVIEEVRVPWAVYVAETEEEGADVIVGVAPTSVTVEAEVTDEVTFLAEDPVHPAQSRLQPHYIGQDELEILMLLPRSQA